MKVYGFAWLDFFFWRKEDGYETVDFENGTGVFRTIEDAVEFCKRWPANNVEDIIEYDTGTENYTYPMKKKL